MMEPNKRSIFGVAWRLGQTFVQMVRGYWKVSKLPAPVVTIFGGANLKQTSFYAQQAHKLAAMLVKENMSVLTGGGPGIMEAISCGYIPIKAGQIRSIGIGVTELGEKPNGCVQDFIETRYFFARKWLLTRNSVGFVFFPGGFGTLDELLELLTLKQTKKMPSYPIVLFGKAYWTPLIDWLTSGAVEEGMLKKEDLGLFIVTDDLYTVFCTIEDNCKIPH